MNLRTRLQNDLDMIIKRDEDNELKLMRTALLIVFCAGLVLGTLLTLLVIG